ncbi:MAG: hypothetical protein Q7R22_017960 [Verrucomicrobiota bacterium JB025]|nr:hypothetical protein [Verrucomicrobiota bacterium JB025]
MKLNNTHNVKSKAGMTLLELTVVILVLLSLISILFVGARAWKKGSDRSANIMNLRNAQQAVRGHANMYGLNDGEACVSATIFGTNGDGDGAYLPFPNGPRSEITYTAGTVVPTIGVLWLTADYDTLTEADYAPEAEMIASW